MRWLVLNKFIYTLAALSIVTNAWALQYDIFASEVAPDTWVIRGKDEPLTSANGGMIANITFIETDDGVVVIDTGSSRRFGEQLASYIRDQTGKDIVRVYNTHEHPDHIFGNQAFDASIIAAPSKMIDDIERDGSAFSDNMYRLVGDWMRGTHVVPPTVILEDGQVESFGEHDFEVISTHGHTEADMALWDSSTQTLIAGDLIFHQRALATPNAIIEDWLAAIERLRQYDAKVIIPGHGPVDTEGDSLDQMTNYLHWLDTTLLQSAEGGLSMTEVMSIEMPDWVAAIPLSQYEFDRTVSHLYRAYENAAF